MIENDPNHHQDRDKSKNPALCAQNKYPAQCLRLKFGDLAGKAQMKAHIRQLKTHEGRVQLLVDEMARLCREESDLPVGARIINYSRTKGKRFGLNVLDEAKQRLGVVV